MHCFRFSVTWYDEQFGMAKFRVIYPNYTRPKRAQLVYGFVQTQETFQSKFETSKQLNFTNQQETRWRWFYHTQKPKAWEEAIDCRKRGGMNESYAL